MSSEVFNRVIALVLLIVAIALAWRAVNGEGLSLDLPFLGGEETGNSAAAVLRNAGQGLDTLAPSQPPSPEPTIRPTPTQTPIPAGW